MKKLFVLFSLSVLLLVAGCASGPKFSEVSGTFSPLGRNDGRIYFYRTGVLGAAIQPDVKLDGTVIGTAKPSGFFFVDRPAGNYVITCSTEVERKLSLVLDAAQTRYVRLNVSMGFMVAHVYPELVEPDVGAKDVANCHYTGPAQAK